MLASTRTQGLLITFIELIKNPRYNFWAHEFTRCTPDIERLFKSVAASCMGPGAAAAAAAAGGKPLDDGTGGAGLGLPGGDLGVGQPGQGQGKDALGARG